jgi:putative solute:sodium symporter small subunit
MGENLYWRRTRRLTFQIIAVWVAVTFGLSAFSDDLNRFSLFGFPLGFYMAAQGSLLIYLGLIWFYNRRMQQLETELGIDDE